MPCKRSAKPCHCCGKETSNHKFCSVRCSHNYNHPTKEYFCSSCNASLGFGYRNKRAYCTKCRDNPKINKNYKDWSKITIDQHFSNLSTFQAHSRIRSLARSVYAKSNKPKSCQYCGYSKHYEVCHRKPISEFSRDTPISVVNELSNLIGLCPNCHWEFDHGLIDISHII